MANPVNRTLLVCSVSALALALATLCYWKLRKRRLLFSPNTASPAVPGVSTSNGSCQQSSYSEQQTSPTTTTTTTTSSSLSDDETGTDISTHAYVQSSDLESLTTDSTSSTTSQSFLLSDEQNHPSNIVQQLPAINTEKASFADIIRRNDVTTSVNGPPVTSHMLLDGEIQTNNNTNIKEEQDCLDGRNSGSTNNEDNDEEEDIGNFKDNDDDLREAEEADSLRVEVSSVCSSILSRDVIDDSIAGEEDTEIEVEKAAEILSHSNNFEHQVQEAVEAQIKKLDVVESLENDKRAEDISKLLSEMHINNENSVTVLSSEKPTDIDAKQDNDKSLSINSPIQAEQAKLKSTENDNNDDNQNIVKKSSKSNTESSAPKAATKQSSSSSSSLSSPVEQLPAPIVNGLASSKTTAREKRSPKSSDNHKDKDANINCGKKKDAQIFNHQRPNQTFAQVVSSKAAATPPAAAAQVNGKRSPHQQQQPTPVEMSIDAYQNYPDSPAQNSQCSPMSELSDQQSLHSSDSGAGSDTNPTTFQSKASDSGAAGVGLASDYSSALPSSGSATEEICYQFNLPTDLCGRLIGSRGHMINSIKKESRTDCVINRSPFHPDAIRVCSIVGFPENVNHALSLIRKRFPIEDYPEMTLAQTNVIPVPTLELNNSCNLTLLPEIMNDAILSCTIDPGHIFVQLPTHPTHPNLQQLDYLMNINYSQPNVPSVPNAVPGIVCVAQTGNSWFRTIVKSVSESGHECEVMFVDYGGFVILPVSALKQIKMEFLHLPFQACECYLYNIAPADETNGWSVEAIQNFCEELSHKLIFVRVVEIAQDQIPSVQLFKRLENNQTLCVNTELVNRGYAKWIDESLAFK